MGYLVCEKCRGHYELKEGESPLDFSENCECGGNLIHKKFAETNFKPTPKMSYDGQSIEKSYCKNCGTERSPNATFCRNCGNSFNAVPVVERVQDEKTSRTVELILGIIGGVFGLIGAILAFFIGGIGSAFGMGSSDLYVLGVSALLASVVGIIGAVYVLRDAKWGGIILIASAIWLLISISLFGALGAVLLGIAGLLALFRR